MNHNNDDRIEKLTEDLEIMSEAMKQLAEIATQLTTQAKSNNDALQLLINDNRVLTKRRKRGASPEASDNDNDEESNFVFKKEECIVDKKTAFALLRQKKFIPLTALIQDTTEEETTHKLGSNILIPSQTKKTISTALVAGKCITAFRAVFNSMAGENKPLTQGANLIANYFQSLILKHPTNIRYVVHAWSVIMRNLTATPYGDDKPPGFTMGVLQTLRFIVEEDIRTGIPGDDQGRVQDQKKNQKIQDQQKVGKKNDEADQICIKFNRAARGCTYARCNRQHACVKCKATTHNLQRCPRADQAEMDRIMERRG
jgi:hypothetical protein